MWFLFKIKVSTAWAVLTCCLIFFSVPLVSLQATAETPVPEALAQALLNLADADGDVVESAVFALGAAGDPALLPALEALRERSLSFWVNPEGTRTVLIARELLNRGGLEGYFVLEAYGGAPMRDNAGLPIFLPSHQLEPIALSRSLRLKITPLLEQLRLFSPDALLRESAATKVGLEGNAEALPMLEKALKQEKNRWVRFSMTEAMGLIQLSHADPLVRKQAAETLGEIHAMDSIPTLKARLHASEGEKPVESDIAVIAAIQNTIQKITAWQIWARTVETLFSAISLSSILLLVSLGLAITFGLMGVINMAHGELMMLGAYTTYVMQELFTAYLPPSVKDLYFFLAIPLAFGIAALSGLLLEKSIIRKLYGRPLETLLATWGISLILQQGVRQIFGAANVDVASPHWLTGGIRLAVGIQLPYNRLFIILLSALSVLSVSILVLRSPIGLKIRAVTQNREMSACMGITTERVDAWTFALGAGLAGMAGAALTLIGNVGPDLGQNYIVDSFLVVVTGGVGKLAGTVGAAFGIGGLNKLFEPGLGAIYAKVAILLLVILFLQKRPSGLFPAKGRSIDS